ncbi:MAG: hypothetical protein AB1798_05645, partial [Spirochaetota bacterium]
RRIGTMPYTAAEWKQMLIKGGAIPKTVEDWSGIENAMKVRPGHKWDPNSPLDIFTPGEKLSLVTRLILKYGISAVFELHRSSKILTRLIQNGYIGYSLIISAKA